MPIDRPIALHEQLCLVVLPIVKGVLLDGGAELLQLRLAPARGLGRGAADGLLAAVQGELVGVVVSDFRPPELAGGQQHRGGGDEFTAGNLVLRLHNAAQCMSRNNKSKTKMSG